MFQCNVTSLLLTSLAIKTNISQKNYRRKFLNLCANGKDTETLESRSGKHARATRYAAARKCVTLRPHWIRAEQSVYSLARARYLIYIYMWLALAQHQSLAKRRRRYYKYAKLMIFVVRLFCLLSLYEYTAGIACVL